MTPTPFSFSRRAYTLLEALVSMTLFALVLGLMVQIFSMVSRHERALQGHVQLLDAAFSGLERCRRECRMAVRWSQPGLSDSSLQSAVEFEVPDYEQDALRLPSPAVLEVVPAWNPLARVTHLRYELIDQTLMRGVLVGASYQRLPLCTNVAGFSLRRQPPRGMEVQLTLLEDGALKTLSQSFQLPCAHSWSSP